MTGRKAIAGLSLLCALFVSAFSASSALATEGTTAFTCGPVATGAKFSDEHCLTSGSGSGFVHTEIAVGTETAVVGSNEKTASETAAATPGIFKAILSTIPVTITCKKTSSEGTLTNHPGPPMTASGPGTATASECETVIEGTKKNCKVKEPIVGSANITTVVEGTEMYVKATGAGAGEVFVSITFENNGAETCPKGITSLNPYKVTGSAIGTPNGATIESKEKEPHSTLKLGGNTAEAIGVGTLRRKGGNPIVLTTTES
jgi:hypothetical protein